MSSPAEPERPRGAAPPAPHPSTAAEAPPPRRWPRRLVAFAAVVAVVVWLGAAGVRLAAAADEARAGERLLRDARRSLGAASLADPAATATLAEARDHFASAASASGSALVAPLRHVPWAGRQLRAFHALSAAAADVLGTGTAALDRVRAVLDDDGADDGGASWAVTARVVADAVDDVVVDLDDVDLGPSEALVGPLADARATMADELADLRATAERGRTVTAGLAGFLEGPRRYLVLAANNAEMQAGWGMPLASGLLEVSDGEMRLSGLEDIGPPVPAGAVTLEGDLARNWGMLAPNEEWRNLALTPRFDAAAPLAARMWEVGGGGAVDGVVAVDPVTLQAVLGAAGPVDVGGVTVGADDALAFALYEQYVRAEAAGETRAERRDRLAELAAATVATALDGSADPVELAEGLAEAAAGRHLLAWSHHAEEQAAWAAAGVDGTLGADSLLVGVVNRGANKLDWFLDVSADLQVRPDGDALEAELRVRLENHAPPGLPEYVAGPVPYTGARRAGDYIAMLAVNLPGAATGARVDGVEHLIAGGPDGPTQLVATAVELPAGGSTERVVRFRLPASQASLVVEPSARAHPVRWSAGERTWRHGTAEVVALPTT